MPKMMRFTRTSWLYRLFPGPSPSTGERYEGALQRLKAEEREVIIARVEMGYSFEELAEVLGKPTPDAARKTAHRALVRLAEEMKRAAE
jgi:DNA-directed RNA polymerase specialized sigma24 family protein